MQKILGYSALQAPRDPPDNGRVRGGRARLGAKSVISAGAVCLPLGPFLISLVDERSGWASLMPGMRCSAWASASSTPRSPWRGVTAVDPEGASLARGVVYMFQVAGGPIGLGPDDHDLPDCDAGPPRARPAHGKARAVGRQAVQDVLAGTDSAHQVVVRLRASAADRIVDVVRDAFAAGMKWAFRRVALLALLGLVTTVLFVGGSLVARRAGARA